PGYTEQERVAAEFAQRFASDHTGLRDDEDFWERANEHFSPELLTDLTLSCAMWLGMGRMLRTLDIGQTCKITL
ncbi:MAG TPA: carboxymuconolactone decarboxylase family protein, partial [Mycobacterium sp.]|nr:carboxymuconolactone decarboxylase family protein [Mycobacterium sp.]